MGQPLECHQQLATVSLFCYGSGKLIKFQKKGKGI